MVAIDAKEHRWSLRTAQDVHQRLQAALPGWHDPAVARQLHAVLSSRGKRKALTLQTSPLQLSILTAVLDFSSCTRILDPWADNHAVEKGLVCPGSRVILNDKLGTRKDVPTELDPLESPLYQLVIEKLTRLDAVVTIPPLLFADLAFVTAMEFAELAVCMQVPHVWLAKSTAPRLQLLNALQLERRLLVIRQVRPSPELCWVCAFSSPEQKSVMVRNAFDHTAVEVTVEPALAY